MPRRICSSRDERPKFQGGFSLVELMVAMALSLVLLAGVVAVFASSRATYETTDRLSHIQDSGRFALGSIARDLRSAGYLGCARSAQLTNALNTPTALLWNFALPVQGFDAQEGAWEPELDTGDDSVVSGAAPGSDVLVVRLPRGEFEPVRAVEGTFMSATTDDIVIEDVTPALIEAGDIVQVSDCNARAVFQVVANTAGVISHGEVAAAGELPGNAKGDIGYAFTDLAELVPIQSVIYYLGEGSASAGESTSEAGGTGSAPASSAAPSSAASLSLWRRVSGSGEPEELVEGVESMQLLFGEANGSNVTYRPAGAVVDWRQVRTVRVALLVRSLSEYGSDVDHGDYEVLDETVADPGDRHLRQVFTTTVGIRNIAS
jgi:type IV pilus assembly protein PilW